MQEKVSGYFHLTLNHKTLTTCVRQDFYRINAYWTMSCKNNYDSGKMSFAKGKYFRRSPAFYIFGLESCNRTEAGRAVLERKMPLEFKLIPIQM